MTYKQILSLFSNLESIKYEQRKIDNFTIIKSEIACEILFKKKTIFNMLKCLTCEHVLSLLIRLKIRLATKDRVERQREGVAQLHVFSRKRERALLLVPIPNSCATPPSHFLHTGPAQSSRERFREDAVSRHLLPRRAGLADETDGSAHPGKIASYGLKHYPSSQLHNQSWYQQEKCFLLVQFNSIYFYFKDVNTLSYQNCTLFERKI